MESPVHLHSIREYYFVSFISINILIAALISVITTQTNIDNMTLNESMNFERILNILLNFLFVNQLIIGIWYFFETNFVVSNLESINDAL